MRNNLLYLTLILSTSIMLPYSVHASVITYTHHTTSVPVSTALEISPQSTLVLFSGRLPQAIKTSDSEDLRSKYGGDTKSQTLSVLKDLQKSLRLINLDIQDIVKVQVFLVGDEKTNNRMDATGFSEAYSEFFSKENSANLPVRTLVQVAGLAQPGMLVEIEITAVKKL